MAFSGGKNDSLAVDNTSIKADKQLISTINKESEIIRMIDSIMDMQTVPVSTLNDVLDKIRENTPKEQQEIPGAEYYSGWDEQNLFPSMNERKFTQEKIMLTGNKQGDFYFPVPGKINSPFGWRDKRMHKGTDLNLVKGEPVHAAFDGVVRIAKKHGGFGNVVIIRHYNGVETLYGHLSKFKVKPGQTVLSGQVIGLGGNTGKSTGAHLHFEIRFKGNAVDPRSVIDFENQNLLSDEIIIKNKGEYCGAYPSKMVVYTINKGDTLARVAKKYGISIAKLKALNSLPGTGRVTPGQKIRIS
jgi:murein DD-endopeptidase MepM/ murein hydrolase activator NlpD